MGKLTRGQILRVMKIFYSLSAGCHHEQTRAPREAAAVSDQALSQTATFLTPVLLELAPLALSHRSTGEGRGVRDATTGRQPGKAADCVCACAPPISTHDGPFTPPHKGSWRICSLK